MRLGLTPRLCLLASGGLRRRWASTRVNFEDHVESFQHKSTWEIVRALAVLRICSVEAFAENGLKLMEWCRFLNPLLKPTLYDQFVGGETMEDLRACMIRIGRVGMRSMLAATMEEDVGGKRSEEVYNKNCRLILTSIKMAAEEVNVSPMVQLKLTGLISADLLVLLGKISTSSATKRKLIEAIAEGIAGSSGNVDFGLNDRNKQSLKNVLGRLKEIGLEAGRRGVKVLVDAEYTYLNPGLSVLALGAAISFNSRAPVFWNTYQCYLKNGQANVEEELRIVKEDFKVNFGAKVVRGAYMLQEKKRASQLKLPDPVCPSYEATSASFNGTVSYLLDRAGHDCQFLVASHNEQSIQSAIDRMEKLKIERSLVSFGQLYGMCDQVSNPLVKAGFSVYKSIPYGSLEEVLPYLARRAAENKCVLQGTRKEHSLLKKELKRRIFHSS